MLVSANVPGAHQLKGLPPRAVFRVVFSSDAIMWLIVTYLPGLMARLSQVLRVPAGVEPTADDLSLLSRTMHAVFPAKMRATGVVFDAYESNPDINQLDLSMVQAPTLVMHALDDPGPPYEAAVRMARQMPLAKILTVESGGHLMLGEHPAALAEAQTFLRQHSSERSDVSEGVPS